MYQQSEKLLNNNISSTSPRNMVHVGLLTAEIGSGLWCTLANFNEFRVLLRYCTDVAQRKSTKLCMMFGRLLTPGLVHYVYSFWGGALAANGILLRAKFTLRPSLALSYIGSVTARHSSSGRQRNFAALYLHATGRPSCSTLGSRTV